MRKADTRQNSIVGLNLDYTCAAMLLRSIVVRVVYCFHALLIVLPSAPRAEGIGLCAACTASCLGYKRSQIALMRFQTESFESAYRRSSPFASTARPCHRNFSRTPRFAWSAPILTP